MISTLELPSIFFKPRYSGHFNACASIEHACFIPAYQKIHRKAWQCHEEIHPRISWLGEKPLVQLNWE
jgi:hypothetical protein